MIRYVLPLVVALSLLVLWLLPAHQQLSPEATDSPSKTPPRSAVVSPARPAGVSAPGVTRHTVEPVDDFDPTAHWKELTALHDRRPPATAEWKARATGQISDYFARANQALASNPDFAKFQGSLTGVDCRDGSCLAELQFESFSQAMAYVEMVQIGRLNYQFNVLGTFDCPLASATIPDESSSALLHYDCVPVDAAGISRK